MAARRSDVMPRLSLATLSRLPEPLRPAVDPRALDVGIVHLGLGAFHRAHQAVFTQAAIAATGDTAWGIAGVTQRSRDVISQLQPQDGLYSVVSRSSQTAVDVLVPMRELLFAQEQATELVGRIAAPTTHVVTLTVTEKGYRHDPATGRLRIGDSEIKADADGRAPLTVVGQLVRGMQARQRADAGRITVVCCDNLHANGRTLAGLVGDFCQLLPSSESADIAEWIGANVSFPSTMVDRIVPATTAADLADAARLLGLDDLGVVTAEPFMQWVIEDSFVAARPKWEAAGAILTADVAPYEAMKLRLLNGSHSALAYLGLLAGYDYVAEFVELDEVFAYVRALMDDDVSPTLSVPDDFDVADYKAQLMSRFANRSLGHRTRQIAMDGSQKLPQRLLGVIGEQLARGVMPARATLAVAGWMRYVSAGTDPRGHPISVDDPLAPLIAERVAGAVDASSIVDALLSIDQVFSLELRENASLRSMLVEQVESLAGNGVLATLRGLGT